MKTQKIKQKISNNPVFENIEREIQIAGIGLNFDLQSLDLYYTICYFKDDKDVSQLFKKETPEWHIDNTQSIIVRDENFNPTLNSEFNEIKDENGKILNEKERYLTTPGFDYIADIIINSPLSLETILRNYILEEDNSGRFN
ncbi:hypothetical protein [Flavobacterium ginsengiterrae]|uniref:Uncharacterized protein n=1 Tax=Flavobacterium ginsengiterrae TaxID=871695 RepID=A0ABP7GUD9_9FLAO